MFGMQEPSDAEKLEAVYSYVQAQKMKGRLKWVLFILLIVGGYYAMLFLAKPENADIKEELVHFAQEKLTEFVIPIVSEVMNGVLQNMTQNGGMLGGTQTGLENANNSIEEDNNPTQPLRPQNIRRQTGWNVPINSG